MRPRVVLAECLGRQKELRAFPVRELRDIESRLRPMPPDCHLLLSRPQQFRDEQVRHHKPCGEQQANSYFSHRQLLSRRAGEYN
jgi:hypothetical protein